jgi:hypothetical protein
MLASIRAIASYVVVHFRDKLLGSARKNRALSTNVCFPTLVLGQPGLTESPVATRALESVICPDQMMRARASRRSGSHPKEDCQPPADDDVRPVSRRGRHGHAVDLAPGLSSECGVALSDQVGAYKRW